MTPGQEALYRFAPFAAVFLALAVWEVLAPRRKLLVRRPIRWLSNLTLATLNSLLVRVLVPISAVSLAAWLTEKHWGLLRLLPLPGWVSLVLAVAVLDLAIYFQHRLFHAVPLLWRLHLVHHADLDFDVTTGLRFHTVEILLSALIKLAAVAALGPSPWAVLAFEVLLNCTSMFNHSNVLLPAPLDRALRAIVVTPEMHRVHHSTIPTETNSNFGFNLPWWDFLFRTYRDQPALGHTAMEIGLSHLRDERETERLDRMLLLPLHGAKEDSLRSGTRTAD
ncbi:MAG TPA: sterol desaturase family protein [Pirellulaceae bacterium]|nr:sterol desaturase family protein [Pirellulaceae bacterium]